MTRSLFQSAGMLLNEASLIPLPTSFLVRDVFREWTTSPGISVSRTSNTKFYFLIFWRTLEPERTCINKKIFSTANISKHNFNRKCEITISRSISVILFFFYKRLIGVTIKVKHDFYNYCTSISNETFFFFFPPKISISVCDKR